MANDTALPSLKSNIYKIFDEIINSGKSPMVVHLGKRLTIQTEEKEGRLSKLKR